MCYKISTPKVEEILQEMPLQVDTPELFTPYYHADGFARPLLPITTGEQPGKLQLGQWKLLPFVVKNEAEAVRYANTLNAQCEEVFNKFSYKNYISKTRCLLWVSGFFEPHHPAPKVTVPYFVYAPGHRPFTLGCVYANWVNTDTGEVIPTFSIITTPANELLAQVHNEKKRMPLIIAAEDRTKWLAEMNKEAIEKMMVPYSHELAAHPVSNMVYKKGVDANYPDIIDEVK